MQPKTGVFLIHRGPTPKLIRACVHLCTVLIDYLEELHSDDGEHELQEQRDEHDVPDGLDGDDDALHDVLEALGAVDGAQGAEHAQHTEDLDHRYRAGAGKYASSYVSGWIMK